MGKHVSNVYVITRARTVYAYNAVRHALTLTDRHIRYTTAQWTHFVTSLPTQSLSAACLYYQGEGKYSVC